MTLDKNVQENWIKQAYKKELPTMGNNLLAAGISTGLTALTTHIAQKKGINSQEALTGIATATDLITYNIVLFGQLAYRDRNDLRDKDNKIRISKIGKKAGEYLSFGASIFFSYGTLRSAAHYLMQKAGFDPVTTSVQIQIGLTTFYTGIMPPLRYGLQKLWKTKE